jgi:hypothetical protein
MKMMAVVATRIIGRAMVENYRHGTRRSLWAPKR